VKALETSAPQEARRKRPTPVHRTNPSVTVQLDALTCRGPGPATQKKPKATRRPNATAKAVGRSPQTLRSGDVTVERGCIRSCGTGNAIALAEIGNGGKAASPYVGGNVRSRPMPAEHGNCFAQANAHECVRILLNRPCAGGLRSPPMRPTRAESRAVPRLRPRRIARLPRSGKVEVDGAMFDRRLMGRISAKSGEGRGGGRLGAGHQYSTWRCTFDVKGTQPGNGSGGARANASFGATSNHTPLDSLNLQAPGQQPLAAPQRPGPRQRNHQAGQNLDYWRKARERGGKKQGGGKREEGTKQKKRDKKKKTATHPPPPLGLVREMASPWLWARVHCDVAIIELFRPDRCVAAGGGRVALARHGWLAWACRFRDRGGV